jgi:hypothetical protein
METTTLKYWNTHTKLAAAVLGLIAASFLLLWFMVLRPTKHMGFRDSAPQQFALSAGETRALTPFTGRVKVEIESQQPLTLGYLPKDVADTITSTQTFTAHAKDMQCVRNGVRDIAFECRLPVGTWTLLIRDARQVRETLPTMYGNRDAFSAASVLNKVTLHVAEYGCLDCAERASLRDDE